MPIKPQDFAGHPAEVFISGKGFTSALIKTDIQLFLFNSNNKKALTLEV